MKQKLDEIRATAVQSINAVTDLASLEQIRVKFLGRKGLLTEVLRGLAEVAPEDRPILGKVANDVKQALNDALESRKAALAESEEAASASAERIDLTLPGRRPLRGHKHPIMRVAEEITDIFVQLGFQVATGPDVETEYYNFDSLNTPSDHPARDLHDTFFIKPGVVLRTHTSPVQMRVMERTQPPVAVIVPGRVYRVDQDASHSPMFYQIEGLLVDKGISFAHLKGVLMLFIQRYFGPKTKMRFRPHYFPFTEPSAEVDISCTVCSGRGCRVCKHSGWLEILGCGMVHPQVFKYAKYDSETYTGFAFGMGIDRIAMLTHAITSIHYLYENDLRFLEQF
ncbi:MAG TPA: phenylalanine--tRNA ligase subunit alpha [Candidatus Hydrogenedentes bacterium]|nr:phenylalanine--tRNA ligase subunit alpha [Candidatus Hydrogenedentota bacterium]HQE82941.1 phenylalanine--tRNA ligase subunit alpha [Candidatus Hydrogenedentota bacterium]HQH51281.1 phenylalanine--tRNA ligase subunit alpha [Candidatus Hydrogenedentota bacterium]HQM50572.1 phenylalanine--tRNA ligase subunit alpha [Candidatus Hydrogenedentota bacterium]